MKTPFTVLLYETCYIHLGRERLAQQALDGGFTHLLFVDSDMFFEPDALDRLIARDKDIVGADYNKKVLPPEGTVIGAEEGDFVKCEGIATGFLLIKTEVFKKLKHPWFFYEADEQGNCITGDDMWFCKIAREAGYDIWCDKTIKVFHLGDFYF
uniref:Putative glycosyltransferase n=1 Tax=viral metagenome TaxID=1070528 RepID=A0A6H1ZQ26_9ZZZZ